MSRSFVGNDQGYDASPRVYVNNMNTAHATVSLPERRPNNREQLRGNDAIIGGIESGGGGGYAGAPIQANAGSSGRVGAGSISGARQSSRAGFNKNDNGATPTTAQGVPVHANLQGVYDRIMRRLQRQMNYAELSRASLAEQYGVDMQLQDEAEEAAAVEAARVSEGGEHDGQRVGPDASLARSSPAFLDADAAAGEGSRPPSQSLSRPVTRTSEGAAAAVDPSSTSKENRRAGGTSRLLQFQQQMLPTAAASTNAFEDAAGPNGGRSDADVEREMDEQPCPRPLRLVVEHVLDTLQKKMTLAETGSLRDCIIFSFEARALLDRLLKEIPLYTQYTAFGKASSGNGGAGGGSPAMPQAVSGVFQQLRKRPVLLPRGEYVEEAATGAIGVELVSNFTNGNDGASPGSRSGRSFSHAAATTRLPEINMLPIINTHGSAMKNNNDGAYKGGLHSPLPEVDLPASYGKSSRLAASTARNYNNNSNASVQPREGGGGAHNGSTARAMQQQRSFHHTVLRDHLPEPNASVTLAADSYGDESELMMSGQEERRVGAGAGHSRESCTTNSYPNSEAAAAHRATQLVSVGTITEDNSVTTVPQSEYAALQQRVEELQTQLAEAQQHRSALANQLCEEEQYTDHKKRIVQYLRETLVRECNMLRTQLHHATSTSQPTLPTTSTNKLSHAMRGMGGTNNASVFKDGPSGPNASAHNASRVTKQFNGAVMSSSATMGVSGLLQQKQSFRHRSESESLGSVYGANYSVTASAAGGAGGGGGGATGRGTGRLSPQFRLGGGGTGKGSPNYLTATTGARSDAFQVEVDAVHSLLDLALLAVEEDAVLPPHAAQLLRSGHGDKDVLHSGFRKNAKQQLDELRVDFEERQQALKRMLLQQTAEHNYVAAEQQAEVVRLRALTDTTHVREVLQESVSLIRAELNRFRMHVKEQLHFFKAILHSTGQGLLHRATLVDSTMSDNVALSSTLNATRELIESANALFLPMLTREYECGYHPWPLKVRNTRDPLGHIVQLRFGPTEVVRLRDSLSEFGKLYVAIHQYVMGHAVLPESARPTTGKPLRDLCAALALNPTSHTDVVFAARRCYDLEGQLRKKLARLQARILWNTYRQRAYTERSMAALAEAGIDPRVTTLPVSRRIDMLAQQRGDLLQARVKIQRERSENAKEVYRLWREKEVDIMEGYPTPQTQRNRLALLSNNGALGGAGEGLGGGGGALVNANARTKRWSQALKRASADASANSMSL